MAAVNTFRQSLRLFAAGLLLLSAPSVRAADERTDGDLPTIVQKQLDAGAKKVVVPLGHYRLKPTHGVHWRLSGLKDVEIVAHGVEMVCTETRQAVRVEDCTNLKLSGLTIDYDPLPFTQGTITGLAEDHSWIEFTVLDGYPVNDLEQRVEIYDPATGQLRREMPPLAPGFEQISPRIFRVHKRPGLRFNPEEDTERLGDYLVTNNGFPANATGHCVELQHCSQVTLEDITVFASPIFGFLEAECDTTTYRRCHIDRRSPEADPVKRAAPRMRSLNADAFHSVGALHGPHIEGCVARYQGDDCVNIHGTYHLVLGGEGRNWRIAVLGRMTIAPGSAVEFLPYSGPRPSDAVAVSATPAAPINASEKALIQKLNMNPNNKERLLTGKAECYTLQVDRDVSLPPLSEVCSGDRSATTLPSLAVTLGSIDRAAS
jgi:hypothetical protein